MDMSGDARLLLRTFLSSKWNFRSDEPQASMKYQATDSDTLGMPADSLLMGACWGPGPEQYKLLLDAAADEKNSLDALDSKVALDTLDSFLLTSTDDEVSVAPDNFAELKPLPPFTGYTGHLSINGISGHHYHAIAAPLSPEPSLAEPNNNTQLANHNHSAPVRPSPHSNSGSGGGGGSGGTAGGNGAQNGGNVAAAAAAAVAAAAAAAVAGGVLSFKGASEQGGALYYSPDQGVVSSSTGLDCADIKEEAVDYNSILDSEDIAALIGSAIADTTVPSVVDDGNASRDSWIDFDSWIDTACSSDGKTILPPDSLEFTTAAAVITAVPNCAAAAAASSSQFSVSPPPANATTLQSLLGYPVTHQSNGQATQPQQNGVVNQGSQPVLVKREATTSFNGHPGLLIKREATTSSFPQPNQQMSLLHSRLQNGPPSPPGHVVSTTDPGLRYHYSPTSTTTPNPSKKSRNRSKSKSSNGGANNSVLPSSSSLVYSADGLLGKEKTIHRCTICSRGFLNKSNIKVHLRTHTGEKPFRCDVCGKAFRQKAHLLKHAMIHKRVGRDDPCGVGYGPHEALRCD